jgi:uncharacterized protein YlxP (DUF503 family)
MEKIKLIVIFTLLLAIGFLSKELLNYQKITSGLLQEYNTQEQKIILLKTNIISLEERLKKQEKDYDISIATLEKKCAQDDLSLKYLNSSTQGIAQDLDEAVEYIDSKSNNKQEIDENKITGYGLEYLQPDINQKDIDE